MILILGRSKFGRQLYAVGGNEEAARFSGINIKKVKIIVYTLCGALASFSGIILAARMYSGQPTAGDGFELDAIAASVLGGVSFSGGVGKLGGTIIGVLVLGVLTNGLNLLNINSFWQYIIKGIIILLAVYLDILKSDVRKIEKLMEVARVWNAKNDYYCWEPRNRGCYCSKVCTSRI